MGFKGSHIPTGTKDQPPQFEPIDPNPIKLPWDAPDKQFWYISVQRNPLYQKEPLPMSWCQELKSLSVVLMLTDLMGRFSPFTAMILWADSW